jgi:hypothetical protein
MTPVTGPVAELNAEHEVGPEARPEAVQAVEITAGQTAGQAAGQTAEPAAGLVALGPQPAAGSASAAGQEAVHGVGEAAGQAALGAQPAAGSATAAGEAALHATGLVALGAQPAAGFATAAGEAAVHSTGLVALGAQPAAAFATAAGQAAGLVVLGAKPAAGSAIAHGSDALVRRVTNASDIWSSKASVLPGRIPGTSNLAVYTHEQPVSFGSYMGCRLAISRTVGQNPGKDTPELRLPQASSFHSFGCIDGQTRTVIGFAHFPDKTGSRPWTQVIVEGPAHDLICFHVGILAVDHGKCGQPDLKKALDCAVKNHLYESGSFSTLSLKHAEVVTQAQGPRTPRPSITLLEQSSQEVIRKQAEKDALAVQAKAEDRDRKEREAAENERRRQEVEAARKKAAKQKSEQDQLAAREARDAERNRRLSVPMQIAPAEILSPNHTLASPTVLDNRSSIVVYQPPPLQQAATVPAHANLPLQPAVSIPSLPPSNSELTELKSIVGSLAHQVQQASQLMIAGQQHVNQLEQRLTSQLGNMQYGSWGPGVPQISQQPHGMGSMGVQSHGHGFGPYDPLFPGSGCPSTNQHYGYSPYDQPRPGMGLTGMPNSYPFIDPQLYANGMGQRTAYGPLPASTFQGLRYPSTSPQSFNSPFLGGPMPGINGPGPFQNTLSSQTHVAGLPPPPATESDRRDKKKENKTKKKKEKKEKKRKKEQKHKKEKKRRRNSASSSDSDSSSSGSSS